MQTAASLIGWAGAVLLLGAYGLVATQRLSSHSVAYHVLNLVGAISLAIYALAIAAWPNVVLNAFWSVVGVIGIFMSVRAIRRIRRPEM